MKKSFPAEVASYVLEKEFTLDNVRVEYRRAKGWEYKGPLYATLYSPDRKYLFIIQSRDQGFYDEEPNLQKELPLFFRSWLFLDASHTNDTQHWEQYEGDGLSFIHPHGWKLPGSGLQFSHTILIDNSIAGPESERVMELDFDFWVEPLDDQEKDAWFDNAFRSEIWGQRSCNLLSGTENIYGCDFSTTTKKRVYVVFSDSQAATFVPIAHPEGSKLYDSVIQQIILSVKVTD